MLEAARGRLDEARRQLALSEAADQGRALSAMALLASAPFNKVSPADLRRVRATIESAPAPPPDDSRVGLSVYFQRPPAAQAERSRLYLSGVLSARLGDRAQATRRAVELDGLARSDSSSMAADFARGIRAELAFAASDPEAALREIEGLRHETYYVTAFAFPELSQARERFLHGEALVRLGRPEEALPWFGSFAEFSPYDMIYTAVGYLRRGELLESLGRPRDALAEYEQFVELWRDADPELQPMVRQAKAAVARLRSSEQGAGSRER